MIDFGSILSNVYFKNLGIPIFSIVMTAAVKIISRKDHSLKITRNDVAVGVNLIVAGLIMLINYSVRLAESAKSISDPALQVQNASKLLNMMILVLLYCLVCFLISVLVRIFGWQKEDEKELNLFFGIIIPLVVGGFLLVVAANYSNQ